MKNSLGACTHLVDVVSFLTARVAKAIGDPSFGRCACVVFPIVFNFLCHVSFSYSLDKASCRGLPTRLQDRYGPRS
jgi:hypothetical protein